ncbi:MAG: DUF917 domain-containing protein [Gammaproteobacteria bacterium]|nr:DUF917 domain-containing protein [Gammaproteobacteria bacterium]
MSIYRILVFSIILLTSNLLADELKVKELSETQLIDMLKGSCIQSTRSCNPGPSISLIKEAIQAGRKFKMISVDDFPDDGIVVAVQGIGGGGPWEYVIERTKSQGLDVLSQSKRNNMVVDLLSEFVGKEITAIIRSEAAEATATALLVAAERNIPILDAGITGRAVPEVQQSIPWISGIASIPTAIVTPWGDEIVIKNAIDEYRVEDLSRAIAVASGGDAVITMTPMNGQQIKYAALKNNLSEAIKYGKVTREAVESNNDPIDALLKVSSGYKLFQGLVTKSDEKGDRGFNWIDVAISGTDDFTGKTYEVFVKNENIIGWLDGEIDAMSPDYIYNLDPKTGESIVSKAGIGSYPIGKEVVLIGLPSADQWRSDMGIKLMGPKHFGFDFDFTPIEELHSK